MPARYIASGADINKVREIIRQLPESAGICFKEDTQDIVVIDPATGDEITVGTFSGAPDTIDLVEDHVLVGGADGQAHDKALSGDATIDKDGLLTVVGANGDAMTATGTEIDAVALPAGALNPGDRAVKCVAFPLDGTALHAAVVPAIQFGADAIILRAIADITTVATGACTLDVGYTSVSDVTSSDTLLDGIDVNAAIATFDSMNAALDAGANAKAQKAASGKWVTVDEKTGDATGLVGTLYIFYIDA